MARDGSGVYTHPAGTTAVTSTTIESTKYNSMLSDVAAALNNIWKANLRSADLTGVDDKLVTGTAGSNGELAVWNTDGDLVGSTFNVLDEDDLASNSALAVPTQQSVKAYVDALSYQPLDGELTALAGLTSAANKIPMFSGAGTATVIDLLDEDTMASNSASAVPTQQSVKAYVDAGDAVAASTTTAGKAEIATSAEFRTGSDTGRVLGVSETWGAGAEVTLTDAATIAVDMATFINAVVTLGGNRTLGNPSNMKVGQSGHIRIVQDGTGSRTLSYGSYWEFAGAVAPTLSTGAADEDVLHYKVISTTRVVAQLMGDVG